MIILDDFPLLASLSPLSISAVFGIATLVSSITAALGFAKINEAIIFLVKKWVMSRFDPVPPLQEHLEELQASLPSYTTLPQRSGFPDSASTSIPKFVEAIQE